MARSSLSVQRIEKESYIIPKEKQNIIIQNITKYKHKIKYYKIGINLPANRFIVRRTSMFWAQSYV